MDDNFEKAQIACGAAIFDPLKDDDESRAIADKLIAEIELMKAALTK